MNSGKWIKSVFRLKKLKKGGRKRTKESSVCGKGNNSVCKRSNTLINGSLGIPVEDVAATRIQTAFRGYKARKALRRLKGALRLQRAIQLYPAQRQSTSTLGHLHSWCNIQSQVRARRLCMVTEGRTKQKKLESQQKLEAKLQNLEVEWSGGAETMDGLLAKIHQREEASVKRERAMAYAFSHQWRANCSQSQGLGSDEFGKSNWGWSWKERWIAARPWETRVSPKKDQSKKTSNKSTKTPKTPVSVKIPVSVKTPVSSVKTPSSKARRLSFPSSEKLMSNEDGPKVKEELVS